MAILSETSKSFSEIGEFRIIKILNDAASGTGTAIDVSEAEAVSLVVEAGAGVSAGVVTLEGAISSDYAGTWASLTTATTNAASKTFIASLGLASSSTSLPVPYVRARVSTGIEGGTVDVYLIVKK